MRLFMGPEIVAPSYRYWRLVISKTKGSLFGATPSIAEIELRGSPAGGDLMPNPITSASADSYSGSDIPKNAFDNSLVTRWIGEASGSGRLEWDVGVAIAPTHISIATPSYGDGGPESFTLYGTNFSSYASTVERLTVTGYTSWANNTSFHTFALM